MIAAASPKLSGSDLTNMQKGQRLTFIELYEYLRQHHKKWRFYAVGGSFGFLNHLRWDETWVAEHFEQTDGGNNVFQFTAYDEEGNWSQTIPFGDYSECDFRIEVYNEQPLEILIDMRDKVDDVSQFAIFQEI